MKANKAQEEALLAFIGRIYDDIHAVEKRAGMRVSGQDFRPRIDYFHDAVRAYTSGTPGSPRLSVERLAYDAGMLRYLSETPHALFGEYKTLSPSTDIVPASSQLPAATGYDDYDDMLRLAEQYGHYTLLFVALLAPQAERNHRSRMNENGIQQDALYALIQASQARAGDAQVNAEEMIAQVLRDPRLRAALAPMLNARKKMKTGEWLQGLQGAKTQLKENAQKVEAAHMRFVVSQLMVYEASQPLVKKMAMQGMNIVGDFVASAVREAQRGDRGRL